MIRVLFLGDVTTRSGRQIVSERLPQLKQELGADLAIVNGENAAHGKGVTLKIVQQLKAAGADLITLGNHAFSKHEILDHMAECPDLIRPANMEPADAGQSFAIRTVKGKRVAVYNVLGNVGIDGSTASCFATMQSLLEQTEADIRIVDFHAEATSEKQLFFQVFHRQLNAVIGTHTHVQTADEMVQDGCAYISDAGMCGPYHSIIGRDIDEVRRRMILGEKTHFTPAEGPAILCGIFFDIEEETCRTVSVQRIQERPQQ